MKVLAVGAAFGCIVAMMTERSSALNVEMRPPALPVLGKITERMEEKGFARGAPIYIRIFKEESALELWVFKEGRFALFETYPICRYDGVLGPKLAEGDRQSPEGFYTVTPSQLRWRGRWHRGFDLAYPNAYDTDQGRTGSAILIHGGCGSIGCYAMTDGVIDELFEIATEAFDGGQPRFSVHVFPFRMTATNKVRHRDEAWVSFWQHLQPAYDLFEATRTPPSVSVCEAEYRIEPGAVGSVGGRPVDRTCESPALPVMAELGAAASAADANTTGMGPLRTRLEQLRKSVPPLEYASLPGRTAKRKGKSVIRSGLVIRCNTRLASCRKWIAVHQRATSKRKTVASSRKRKTANAKP